MLGRVALVACLALAAAACIALVAACADDEEAAPDPVESFLAAYERSRTATFVAEQTFTRAAADGRSISYPRRLVQRPPDDRLVVGGGQAEGRLDGRVVLCSTSPDGASRCDEGAEALPYDEEVATEVDDLRALVEGEAALYEVRPGEPGCWSLHLVRQVLTPPYGDRAGFCFDEATGAPLRTDVQRDDVTDTVVTQEVRSTVTAADLRTADLGELPSF